MPRRTPPAGMAPIFDVPGVKERSAPQPPRTSTAPVWASYRPKNPERCDECMAALIASGGGPVRRKGRWSRRVGTVVQLLCDGHMKVFRRRDNLPPMKERGQR